MINIEAKCLVLLSMPFATYENLIHIYFLLGYKQIGRWVYVFNVYGCASESRHGSIEFNADVDYCRNYHDYYVVLLAYEFAFVRFFSLTIFKGFLCLFDYFCLCLAKTTTDIACKLIIDGFTFYSFACKIIICHS